MLEFAADEVVGCRVQDEAVGRIGALGFVEKRQPLGISAGVGTVPGMIGRRSESLSRRGIELKRPMV